MALTTNHRTAVFLLAIFFSTLTVAPAAQRLYADNARHSRLLCTADELAEVRSRRGCRALSA